MPIAAYACTARFRIIFTRVKSSMLNGSIRKLIVNIKIINLT